MLYCSPSILVLCLPSKFLMCFPNTKNDHFKPEFLVMSGVGRRMKGECPMLGCEKNKSSRIELVLVPSVSSYSGIHFNLSEVNLQTHLIDKFRKRATKHRTGKTNVKDPFTHCLQC